MEFDNGVLQLSPFFSVTIGIVVLFLGKRVNDGVGFLREFSMPEPATGGINASLKDLLAGGKPLVILLSVTIACATFGLILASLMGGPIAKFLITRHKPNCSA